MPPAASQFPTFDEWKTMSEREQDALLDRMEAHKRRNAVAIRLLIALGCACLAAIAGFAALALL